MSEEIRLFLILGGLLAFVVFGNRHPRVVARLIQVALTAFFSVSALFGLGMTLLGKSNSTMGGFLFTGAAVALAFVSFHVFDWMIRYRFGR